MDITRRYRYRYRSVDIDREQVTAVTVLSRVSFLQRVSIACYAKRCISHRKFCPTV